jgi:cytochrome c oxidase subunit IV
MVGHIISPKIYFLIFFVLLALTALTTAVAFVDLGSLNTVAALAIAVCKASLVILFFMHLKYSPGMTRIVLVAALFWLAILLVLAMGDYATRNWTPVSGGWESSQVLPGR